MKIVQFITRMDVLGGAQIHVLDLTIGLVQMGHQVVVLSSGQGLLTKELRHLNIPYYELHQLTAPIHPVKDLKALVEVKRIIKDINPDFIAIHSSKAGIIGRIAGKMLKIPTVFTAHSWSFSGLTNPLKRRFYIFIEKIVGKLSHGIITVSNYDYKLGQINKIAPHAKIQVIHNGIQDIGKTNIRTGTSIVNLIMVARFAYPKDHIMLLQALKKISNAPWRLTLIGEGPLEDDVKEYVKANKLEGNVTFLGECREVTNYLSLADVFLLITKSEGLPISIIEAMRAGLPVVASNVGGIAELIDNNENGILVENNNVSDLISAINTIVTDRELRIKLGKKAREKYSKSYTHSKMLRDTTNFYKSILTSEK